MKQQNNDSKIAAAKIGFISRILIYITKDTKKKKKSKHHLYRNAN